MPYHTLGRIWNHFKGWFLVNIPAAFFCSRFSHGPSPQKDKCKFWFTCVSLSQVVSTVCYSCVASWHVSLGWSWWIVGSQQGAFKVASLVTPQNVGSGKALCPPPPGLAIGILQKTKKTSQRMLRMVSPPPFRRSCSRPVCTSLICFQSMMVKFFLFDPCWI